MERLTERNEYGVYYPYCDSAKGCGGHCASCEFERKITKKLADYEYAEEQGLLLRLPCKVDDTAYYVHREYCDRTQKWTDHIDEVIVDSFVLNVNLFVNVSLYIGGDRFSKTLTPYKTLFFTKEEAEQALANMKKT